MTRVSKYPISKDVYEGIVDIFFNTISKLQTRSEISHFLDEFLTPTERIMFAKRLAIGMLLAKDYNYYEIKKVLRVSTGTIWQMATLLKYRKSYKEMIQKLLKDEKIDKFWLGLGEKIATILSVGGKGSGSWVYLRNELKRRKIRHVL